MRQPRQIPTMTPVQNPRCFFFNRKLFQSNSDFLLVYATSSPLLYFIILDDCKSNCVGWLIDNMPITKPILIEIPLLLEWKLKLLINRKLLMFRKRNQWTWMVDVETFFTRSILIETFGDIDGVPTLRLGDKVPKWDSEIYSFLSKMNNTGSAKSHPQKQFP